MRGRNTRERLPDEIIQMQKAVGENTDEHDGLIKRFQMLNQYEGLFSKVIENLPYPVAVFERSGVIILANLALLKEAGIDSGDVDQRKINFLNRITNDNESVLEAAEDVFFGETTVLKDLAEPLSIFGTKPATCRSNRFYRNLIFFPVTGTNGEVVNGAVILMK